jgi:hypothetical protein
VPNRDTPLFALALRRRPGLSLGPAIAGLALLVAAAGLPDRALAIPLVVAAGDNVVLGPGTYQYDSVSVDGTLRFTGGATLVVAGDVDVSSQGSIQATLGAPLASGSTGADGLPGTMGVELSRNGGAGTPAASGTDGGVVLGVFASTALAINSGGDVTIDGTVSAANAFSGGSGGRGGTGGLGGDGYNVPIGTAGTGGDGGAGGPGGNGGNGSDAVLAMDLSINAAGTLTLGATANLSTPTGNGGNGGQAGNGRDGGRGRDGRQDPGLPPVPAADGGSGGMGGSGGQGGSGADSGDIFLQGRVLDLNGQVTQNGGRGGSGGPGHNGGRGGGAGRVTDLAATTILATGQLGSPGLGGAGGDGANGGKAGRLVLRGASVSSTATQTALGGAAGLGGLGGRLAVTGPRAASGSDGIAGFDGSTTTQLVSAPFLSNGDFSQGTAFFRQSGGGTANVVDVLGNAVLELSTDTNPLGMSQIVDSTSVSVLSLELEYQFLTVAGTLEVLLGSTTVLTITDAGVTSGFGTPAISPTPLTGFTHVALALTDATLLSLGVTELTLQFLPGSLATVQVDNLSFSAVPEPAGVVLLAMVLVAVGRGRRRRQRVA